MSELHQDIDAHIPHYCPECGAALEVERFADVTRSGRVERFDLRCHNCGFEQSANVGRGVSVRSPRLVLGSGSSHTDLDLPDTDAFVARTDPTVTDRVRDTGGGRDVPMRDPDRSLSRVLLPDCSRDELKGFARRSTYQRSAWPPEGVEEASGLSRYAEVFVSPAPPLPPSDAIIFESTFVPDPRVPGPSLDGAQDGFVHLVEFFLQFAPAELARLAPRRAIRKIVNRQALAEARIVDAAVQLTSGELTTWGLRSLEAPTHLTLAEALIGNIRVRVVLAGDVAISPTAILSNLIWQRSP